MDQSFDKEEMLSLLHSLDKKLSKPINLHICGGAAGILAHELGRKSMDIDIIESSPVLEEINNEIIEVAKENDLKDEKWINNDSIRGDHYIPEDYTDRLIKIDGTFDNIKAFCISKIDLVITKLSIYSIRERDVDDISELKLNKEEYRKISEIIDRIAKHNLDRASFIDHKLNALNPYAAKRDNDVNEKNSIHTLKDALAYAKNKYSLVFENEVVSMWKNDLMAGEITISKVIEIIDSIGIKVIKKEKQRKNNNNGLSI